MRSHKKFGPNQIAVLTFIGYINQTNRQAGVYVYRYKLFDGPCLTANLGQRLLISSSFSDFLRAQVRHPENIFVNFVINVCNCFLRLYLRLHALTVNKLMQLYIFKILVSFQDWRVYDYT